MKFLWLYLFSFIFVINGQNRVQLGQNEEWVGNLKELDQQQIVLESELTEKEIKFKREWLKTISFDNPQKITGEVTLRLVNGDLLYGKIVQLDQEKLIFATDFLGELKLFRKDIAEISFNGEEGKVLVSGVNKEGGWQGLIEENNLLTQMVTKELSSSEPIRVKAVFDFSGGEGVRIGLSNYSEQANAQGTFNSSMQFYSNQERVVVGEETLVARRLNFYSNSSNNLERKSFNRSGILSENLNQVKFEIFLNPKNNFFALKLDNNELGQVNFNNAMPLNYLSLSLRPYSGKLRVVEFLVEKWDGDYENIAVVKSSETEENIYLNNGDVAFGKVLEIKNSEIAVETKLGKQTIPLRLVTRIELKNKVVPKSEDVTFYGSNNFRLLVKLDLIDQEFIKMRHEILGEIKVPRKCCGHLAFNKNVKTGEIVKSDALYLGKNKIFGKVEYVSNIKSIISNNYLVDSIELKAENFIMLQFYRNEVLEKLGYWQFELINGDIIFGEVKSFKDGLMVVNSKAGEIQFKKEHIYRMYKTQVSSNLSIKEIENQKKIQLNFIMNTELLSDKYNLSSSQFQIRIFGDNLSRKSYYFRLSQVPIMYFVKLLQPEKIREIPRGKDVAFSLKVDKETGVFEIWANGEKCYAFKDPDGFQGAGNNFRIYGGGQGVQSLHLVGNWDPWIKEKQYVIDKNMQLYAEAIGEIFEGEVSVGGKRVKLEDITEVKFPTNLIEKGKEKYQVVLINRSKLNVESFSTQGEDFVLRSAVFGEFKVPLTNVKLVRLLDEGDKKGE